MPLNRFEHNIRNKLEERRIKPSDDAWDKLANKLEEEDKKSRIAYWWMGVAAAVLLGALIFGLFPTNRNIENTHRIAANSSVTEQHKKLTKKAKPSSTTKKPKPAEKTASEIHQSNSNSDKNKTKTIDQRSQTAGKKSGAKEVKPKSSEPKPKNIINPQTTGEIKTALAANIQTPDATHNTTKVSDAEINKLLQEARTRIKAQSTSSDSQNTVNAYALLHKVELERHQSLTDRVFRVIKTGLNTFDSMIAGRVTF